MQFAFNMVMLFQDLIVEHLSPGVSVRSKIHCVSLCSMENCCLSVFYDQTHSMCYMQESQYEIRNLTISAPGFQYLIRRNGTCGLGYTLNQDLNLFYKLYTCKKTWHEAKRVCEQDGGHLLKVDSDELHDFVARTAKRLGKLFLGGTDEAEEGKWFWPDGSMVQTKFWAPGQPNNYRNQDFMLLFASETSRYKLHDGGIGEKKPFLCQK